MQKANGGVVRARDSLADALGENARLFGFTLLAALGGYTIHGLPDYYRKNKWPRIVTLVAIALLVQDWRKNMSVQKIIIITIFSTIFIYTMDRVVPYKNSDQAVIEVTKEDLERLKEEHSKTRASLVSTQIALAHTQAQVIQK
jgi:hypothetical protein